MKLVLKLPEDKPPFIGIQFASSYIASKTNADILWQVADKSCELILEPINSYNIRITLECKEAIIKKVYETIEYSNGRLKSWLEMTKNADQFNFAHLIQDLDKHVVVKVMSNNRNFVIKLDGVKLLTEM